MLFSSLSFFPLVHVLRKSDTETMVALSVAVTGAWTYGFTMCMGRRRKQTDNCVRGRTMLTQILATFPHTSNLEHQCKTRERAISSETMMLHLRFVLPPAVSGREGK